MVENQDLEDDKRKCHELPADQVISAIQKRNSAREH